MFRKLAIGCGGLIGLVVLLGIIGGLSSGTRVQVTPTTVSAPSRPQTMAEALGTSMPAKPTAAMFQPTAPPAPQSGATAPTKMTIVPTVAPSPTDLPTRPPTAIPAMAQGTRADPYPSSADVIVNDVRWRILKVDTVQGLRLEFGGTKRTTGKFVVVAAQVENLGKEMKTMTHLDLLDSQDRKFTSSTERFSLKPPQVFLLENLNPNMPFQFSDVFEVPMDATRLMVTISDLRLLFKKLAYVSLDVPI